LNKINLNKDFFFSSSDDGIKNPANLIQKNFVNPLYSLEDKPFSDLNFYSNENKLQQFNYDLYKDYSIYSFDDNSQSSKNSDLEFESLKKDLEKSQINEKTDYLNKYLKDNIPFPVIKNYDLIEESKENVPLSFNKEYKDKIPEKNEKKNEDKIENNNNGISYGLHKKKVNKFMKKIKFLIFSNVKEKCKKKIKYIEKDCNKTAENLLNIKEFNEKNIFKKYKYKCEHPGCNRTFRTLKLKLKKHDLSDCKCKMDTITLLYMINNVKKLFKKGNGKSNARLNHLKKLYKKCIFSLPHKEYSINIVGNNFIN